MLYKTFGYNSYKLTKWWIPVCMQHFEIEMGKQQYFLQNIDCNVVKTQPETLNINQN